MKIIPIRKKKITAIKKRENIPILKYFIHILSFKNNLRIPNNRSPQLKFVAKNPKGKAPIPKDI